jgi:hybrid polyketide synthase/nonribosomal peptide synthetase ACE1
MIEHGAKYIVITSRNPKFDPKWIADIEAHGAVVKIIANDITNRDSVRSVYEKICAELPSVGGVAQGAMVLQDTMISEMDLDRVQNVLRPKVNGSVYLTKYFPQHRLNSSFSSLLAFTLLATEANRFILLRTGI